MAVKTPEVPQHVGSSEEVEGGSAAPGLAVAQGDGHRTTVGVGDRLIHCSGVAVVQELGVRVGVDQVGRDLREVIAEGRRDGVGDLLGRVVPAEWQGPSSRWPSKPAGRPSLRRVLVPSRRSQMISPGHTWALIRFLAPPVLGAGEGLCWTKGSRAVAELAHGREVARGGHGQ